jgi:hypothetical protein
MATWRITRRSVNERRHHGVLVVAEDVVRARVKDTDRGRADKTGRDGGKAPVRGRADKAGRAVGQARDKAMARDRADKAGQAGRVVAAKGPVRDDQGNLIHCRPRSDFPVWASLDAVRPRIEIRGRRDSAELPAIRPGCRGAGRADKVCSLARAGD